MTKADVDYLNFADDKEKMWDFAELSKDEFLRLYSYLEEEEYDATVEWLKDNGITAIGQYRRLNWQDYLDYLDKWILEHKDITNCGMSPACFDEWDDNENQEV